MILVGLSGFLLGIIVAVFTQDYATIRRVDNDPEGFVDDIYTEHYLHCGLTTCATCRHVKESFECETCQK